MKHIKQIFISMIFFIGASIWANAQVYEKGTKICDSLFSLSSSQELLEIYSRSSSILDYYNSKQENFTKSDLVECYEFSFSFDDIIETFLADSDVSPRVKEYFTPMQLTSMVIALFGMDETQIVLNAIFQKTVVFDCPELKENINLIYIFKNSYPIIITFTKGEDNAVLANAYFIYKDELINCSKKELQSTLNNPYLKTRITKYSKK